MLCHPRHYPFSSYALQIAKSQFNPIVVPSGWSKPIGILAMATDNERRVRAAESFFGPIARRWIGTLRPLDRRAQAYNPWSGRLLIR